MRLLILKLLELLVLVVFLAGLVVTLGLSISDAILDYIILGLLWYKGVKHDTKNF